MFGLIREAILPAIEFPSTSFSHQPLILYTTSSALKSSPLLHFTPLRTCNVYWVASALTSQLSSNIGSNVESVVYLINVSQTIRPIFPFSDQSYKRGSSNGRTLIEIFNVPPFLAAAAAGLGAATPIKPYAVAVVAPKAVAIARNSRRSNLPDFTSFVKSGIFACSGLLLIVFIFIFFSQNNYV